MGVCKKEEKGLKRTKPRGESKARERLTEDESRPGQAEETRDGTNLVHQAKQITRAACLQRVRVYLVCSTTRLCHLRLIGQPGLAQ